MSANDNLANVFTAVRNAERLAKPEVFTRPKSKLVTECLKLMQKNGYIGEFEIIEDGRGSIYHIKLVHRINNCGVVKPRFPTKLLEFEKWEQRFLPANDVGFLIVSTPKGIMTHREAKQKKLGGALLGFFF